MTTNSPFMEMIAISKGFPGVQALSEVSFDLYQGEVHALVGENGAGKSTLMKILSGAYLPDTGKIKIDGQDVLIQSPRHAQGLGISIVHQELNLFQNLSIAENLFGGKMPASGWLGFEDRKKAQETANEYLQKFELSIDPKTRVGELSLAQQQVVEISKALARNAKVLILDEPTSSLTEHEVKLLFGFIKQLREDGLCIIYISHRLEEIFNIADRVTVLRDGHKVGTENVAEIDVETVIRMMVGRKLEDLYGKPGGKFGSVVLEAQNLTRLKHFDNVSFKIQAGEILGMAGLVGAGRSDVGLALFGANPVSKGSIQMDGKNVHLHSPQAAMAMGIAYLSENRQSDSLFLGMDIKKNIVVSLIEKLSAFGFIDQTREYNTAKEYVQKLNVQTPSLEQKILKLSGGNQQKVVLARWLAIKPRVLIVDEPTRGIDVGAKVEIYMLLRELAAEGVAILLISSEMPEILGLSDRILVMHEGVVTGILARAEATEEKIMAMATSEMVRFH
ncbi:MAG: sugar ABC transporter ATP-binding protein [Chloroflexi bacterium]|nr:sugar ABC transporter ATP-binding protein [Chloroflexota bacterium]